MSTTIWTAPDYAAELAEAQRPTTPAPPRPITKHRDPAEGTHVMSTALASAADRAAVSTSATSALARLVEAERRKSRPDQTWLIAAEGALDKWRDTGHADNAALLHAVADGGPPPERWSWGRQFVHSPQFRQRNGGIVAPVEMPGYFAAIEERLGGAEMITPRTPPIASPIASRCTPYPAGRLSVAWPRITGTADAAEQEQGEEKAQADLGLEVANASLTYTAVWLPYPRSAWDDLGVLQTLVDGALRRSLARAVDESIAATLADDPDIAEAAGPDLAAAIRFAALDLGAAGYGGLVALGSPATLAAIPPADVPGVTMIATRALTAGLVITADLSAVLLATRGAPVVLTSDSVGERFLANELVLLAEVAARALVTDPSAARKIGGGNGEPPEEARALPRARK